MSDENSQTESKLERTMPTNIEDPVDVRWKPFLTPICEERDNDNDGELTTAGEPITTKIKEEVLRVIEKLLASQAFAFAVDFAGGAAKVKFLQRSKVLQAATTVPAFVKAVNLILGEFKLSHLFLTYRTGTGNGSSKTNNTDKVGKIDRTRDNHDGSLVPQVPRVRGLSSSPLPYSFAPADDNRNSNCTSNYFMHTIDWLTIHDDKPIAPAMSLSMGSAIPASSFVSTGSTALAHLVVRSFGASYNKLHVQNFFEELANTNSNSSNSNNSRTISSVSTVSCVGRLTLDLRNNTGGKKDNLFHLLSFLFPHRAHIATLVHRDKSGEVKRSKCYANSWLLPISSPSVFVSPIKPVKRTDQTSKTNQVDQVRCISSASNASTDHYKTVQRINYCGPLTVRVNKNTASCSEYCAVVLRELRGAKIIAVPMTASVKMTESKTPLSLSSATSVATSTTAAGLTAGKVRLSLTRKLFPDSAAKMKKYPSLTSLRDLRDIRRPPISSSSIRSKTGFAGSDHSTTSGGRDRWQLTYPIAEMVTPMGTILNDSGRGILP